MLRIWSHRPNPLLKTTRTNRMRQLMDAVINYTQTAFAVLGLIFHSYIHTVVLSCNTIFFLAVLHCTCIIVIIIVHW